MFYYKIRTITVLSLLFIGCTPQEVKENPQSNSNTDVNNSVVTKNLVITNSKRVALVIGNGAYFAMADELQSLPNPANDAEDIANQLSKFGFDVTLLKDGTLEAMDDAIHSFSSKINKGDVALLYYSGHGIQVGGENFLLPVDAKFKREDQVERQAIKASLLLDKLDSASTKIVFLDACRNNPFLARSMRASRGMGSVRGGLAKTLAPDGTLLVYSTDPDNVAEDGNGRNSPFTQSLLKNMGTPGIDAQIMLRHVRTEVRHNTDNRQTPWDSSSLEGEFYFVPHEVKNEPPPTVPTPPSPAVLEIAAAVEPSMSKAVSTPTAPPLTATQVVAPVAQTVTPIEPSEEAKLENERRQQELARALIEARNEAKRLAAAEAETKLQAPVTPPVENIPSPIMPIANATTLIAEHYRDNGDGTVTDIKTSLMWKRCSEGQTWTNGACIGDSRLITWLDAMPNGKQRAWINFAGYSDWRIPSIDELRTLVYCSSGKPKTWNDKPPYHHGCDGEYTKPTIDTTAFPSTLSTWFWSTCADPMSTLGEVLTLYFEDGDDYGGDPSNPTEVRLVRGSR